MPRQNDVGNEAHAMGQGKCTRDTERAILVVIDDRSIWIPKSCVHDDSEVWEPGQEGEVVTKRWWAEKNGHA